MFRQAGCFLVGVSRLDAVVIMESFVVWVHVVAFHSPCEIGGSLYSYFFALVFDASYVDLELVALEFGVLGLAVCSPGFVVGVASC